MNVPFCVMALIRSVALENCPHRPQDDHQILYVGPVVDVEVVQANAFGSGYVRSPGHLPQTGDTWFDETPALDEVFDRRPLARNQRPGTHDAHRAGENVEQLGD